MNVNFYEKLNNRKENIAYSRLLRHMFLILYSTKELPNESEIKEVLNCTSFLRFGTELF